MYTHLPVPKTLNLAAPLVLFEKSRLWAGTGFHLLPSIHHHSTQHNNTTQTVTLTVTLTSTVSLHYTDTHPTRNVVCPSGAWFENRPHSTPSIHLAWNPKHVIVHWNTHTFIIIIIIIITMKRTKIIFKSCGLGTYSTEALIYEFRACQHERSLVPAMNDFGWLWWPDDIRGVMGA